MFGSVAHLGLFLVCGVRQGLWSFFPYGCPVIGASFVEETFHFPLGGLDVFVGKQLTRWMGLFLGSLFHSVGVFVDPDVCTTVLITTAL